MEQKEKKSLSQIFRDSFNEIKNTFGAFFNAPRALWGIYIPYFTEGLVYFGVLTILGKFCSENVMLSDLHSGWIYGAVTGGITFAMLFLGGVSDKIGVRGSLILSLALMMVGRGVVSLSGTYSFGNGLFSPMFYMTLIGLFFVVFAYGLYQPAAYAGVKKYTNPKTSAMAYALVYGLMNLGAFFSGLLSPLTRHASAEKFPPNGLSAVFWVYTIITLISVLCTVFILTKKADKDAHEKSQKETAEINQTENKEKQETKIESPKVDNTLFIVLLLFVVASFILIIYSKLGKITLPNHMEYFPLLITGAFAIWEFLRKRPNHPFRDIRFVFFIFALVPVQTLFAHTWLTVPYYLDRAFAGTYVSNYFELFSNLNPILIFVFAPIIAGFTAKTNTYKMMIIGTMVMAVPTFMLAAPPSAFIFLFYTILMTIGEAIWSPRFLQWIAEIAPEGKAGAYMGIGQLPWFLTKFVTASYSGYFVANYIPKIETGLPMKAGQMWLLYAFIAIITPFALIFARKWMMKGFKEKA